MATQIKSLQELHDLFITALQAEAPELTDDSEGSNIDALAGTVALVGTEVQRLIVDKFNKTFFDTAHGPEVTGGDDDLQTLAVDHFGDAFARPVASMATGIVAFGRANADAGDVLINVGTIVKTAPNASGIAQRFAVTAAVTLTGTSINASVAAVEGGVAGNVDAGEVSEIETALTDSSVTVTNAAAMAGGEEAEDDAAYRETIRNKIEALAGATLAAIEAAAKAVAGIVTATAIELDTVVRPYAIATGVSSGTWFRVTRPILYVADANGVASQALLDLVAAAVANVRAAGVRVEIAAATALSLDWTAEITLNPAGPNYSTLLSNTLMLRESMSTYINGLAVGTSFIKATADAAMLAMWGPAGTNDLTDFDTIVPSGNVAATSIQKLIAGAMGIA